MNNKVYYAPIAEGIDVITRVLQDELNLDEPTAKYLATDKVQKHFDQLKDSLYLVAENNYIDKVYRDSYYHYYSSKLNQYKRACIKISFFDGEVKDAEFRDATQAKELQEKYRGFIVLRPTEPYLVGRSLISPKALKVNTFLSCATRIYTTVNSVKFYVDGFPHSSQDNETISCAETTLWAVMEYFSTRYPEYSPILPSKIINVLNRVTSERQVPSKGLNIQQMSFALKEFGFGTRIYSRYEYGDFDKILSSYIESGVPLILGVDDYHLITGSIGHAMLCIGHESVTDGQIDAIPVNNLAPGKLLNDINRKKLKLYDWDDVAKEFIFVDDNFPVYQKALISQPVNHYPAYWSNCRINHFIVPLYPKIYLEAFEAKNFILRFLTSGPAPILDNKEVLIRFYLASSRTYKDWLALNSSFQADVRGWILETPMPKFVWVAELSDKSLIKQKKANGIIILDATEANILFNKPLVFAAYQDKVIKFSLNIRKLEDNPLTLSPFSIFENNLRAI